MEPDLGTLLHSDYNIRIVKDFVYCGAQKTNSIPDFIKMKEPTFWEYDTGRKNEWKTNWRNKRPRLYYIQIFKSNEILKSKNIVAIVQQTKTAGQQKIISAKQIPKE